MTEEECEREGEQEAHTDPRASFCSGQGQRSCSQTSGFKGATEQRSWQGWALAVVPRLWLKSASVPTELCQSEPVQSTGFNLASEALAWDRVTRH